MTVRVEYKASAKSMCGRRVVRLERTLATKDGKQAHAVTLTAEDALNMVRTYREGEDGRFEDVLDGGRRIVMEMVPWESYTMRWTYGKTMVADSLWSDWAGPLMDEIEQAGKEAGQ